MISINDALVKETIVDPSLSNLKKSSLPPLDLTSPKMVFEHLPCCTLFLDALPKDLANSMFLEFVNDSLGLAGESQGRPWQRNKWWLSDRVVESPHTTIFLVSGKTEKDLDGVSFDECAQYWYAAARNIIEHIVNGLMAGDAKLLAQAHRDAPPKRYGEEWDGPWSGNVLAANCYRGGSEAVGFHADQLTYLGPYPTIASLSLGVARKFKLRATPSLQDNRSNTTTNPTPPPRTFSISLPHNSLLIMHPPCQENFKHCVPPQNGIDVYKPDGFNVGGGGAGKSYTERINLTFRFYRPDFAPLAPGRSFVDGPQGRKYFGTPHCRCGVPTLLRADQKGKGAAFASGSSSASAFDSTITNNFKFFWQCQAGSQNEGRGCKHFQFLDMKREGRGPCLCLSASGNE